MSDETNTTDLVHVVDPYGNLGTIDRSEADDAINNGGFRLANQQEVSDALNAQKYGDGLGNSLKAFAAGAARAATFGGSDLAMTKSGLVDPETLKQLQERHPLASGAGEIAGIGGALMTGGASEEAGAALGAAAEGAGAVEGGAGLLSLLNPVKAVAKAGEAATEAATPAASLLAGLIASPEARPLANKILSTAGAHAVGSAVEGAAYGLGQSVTEYALGDPDLNGEKVLSNVGYSSLIGGGLGAAMSGAFAGAKGFFSPKVESAALRDNIAADTANAAAASGPGEFISDELGTSKPVNSLEDVAERVKNSNLPNLPTELPSKQTLIDAISKLPDLNFPVTPLQLEALDNPRVFDIYRTFLDSGAKEAQDLQNYLALQKGEGIYKTKATLVGIAPNETLTSDALRGGEDLVQKFTDSYQAEKKELAPIFKKFDDASVNLVENRQDLVDRLQQAIPGTSDYLKLSPEGLKLDQYKPTMPFSRNTYGAIQDLVEAANDDKLTLGGLRNVRESMRDRVNWLAAPRDSAQISSLRKSLMDYLEDQVQKIEPDVKVRETFKRYAVNEQNRETIEKIFGGSISDKASFAKEIKPEDVLDKVFSNSVSVGAAKEILGQNFDKALGDYLSSQMEKVTDSGRGGFSSQQFSKFLKRKAPELTVAFAEKPQMLERLNALTDFMRILPDVPPVNPSGTAKTLSILSGVEKLRALLHPIETAGHIISNGAEKLANSAEQARLKGIIDGVLDGQSLDVAENSAHERMAKYTVLGTVERMAKKTSQSIQSRAKSIFNFADKNTDTISGYAGSKLTPKEKQDKHKDLSKQLHALNNNVEKLSDTLDNSTKSLYATAPNISSGIQQATIRATQFLASKVPQGRDPKPLSKPYIPSQAELAKFNRYYDAVEKPTQLLDHVKIGTLTPEAMEAVGTVYPKLMAEMQSSVLEHLNNHIAKGDEIPYRNRLALSMFLGQNLDHSLDQQTIAANQMAMANLGQAQAASQAKQQARVSKTGIGKITQPQRLLTDLQSTAQRA